MALYGLSLYGQDVYGLPGFGARAGQGFSAGPVVVEPTDINNAGKYGRTLVRWTIPTGNWSKLRVVRKFSGFPASIFDGTVVYEGVNGLGVRSLQDTDLTEGLAAHYTVFVQSATTSVWFNAGAGWTMVVEDHDFQSVLGFALPDSALAADHNLSHTLPEGRKYPLRRFMSALAFEMDRAKTYVKALEPLYDPDRAPALAIPLLVEQFGITPEPSIGDSRLRTVARNAAYLNAKRGTLPGVEALASAFTGWGATVTVGRNLALRDDHVNWTASDTSTIEAGSATPVSDAQFGVIMEGPAVTLRTADVATRQRFYAIPVQPNTQYTYSLETQYDATPRDITLRVRHWNAAGTFLSQSTGTAFQGADTTWVRGDYTFTTPANAAFTELAFDIAAGVATEEHYFKNAQLEEGASFTSYEPPRQAVITFAPPNTNFITTPSFEDAVTPAFTVTNATSAFSAAQARSGVDSWLLSPVTLGTDSVVDSDDRMTVQAGDPAMLRASLFPVTTDVTVTAELVWRDNGDTELSTTSQDFDLIAGEWNDLFLVEQAPGGAALVSIRLTWLDEDVHLDAVALIDTYGAEYFDGDTLQGETLWAGGADHNAVSYYYPLKQVKDIRLSKVLPHFLPLNRSFTLKYAS